MSALTTPNTIGTMKCACGAIMEVRQRKTGSKLLYTYCPTCKVDQRNSPELQKYWSEGIKKPVGIGNTPPKATTQTPVAEWEPEKNTESTTETTEKNQLTPVIVVGGFLALFFGLKFKGIL